MPLLSVTHFFIHRIIETKHKLYVSSGEAAASAFSVQSIHQVKQTLIY